MRILVTGSAGHLGEALMITLRAAGHDVIGLDLLASPFTDIVASISSHRLDACMKGADAVIHTATLHKPHVASHSKQAFIDTNITGTRHLLEAGTAAGVGTFVFTSTTSVFGRALRPPAGAPAAWITESVRPLPRNIYGVTKAAAEDLCELFHLEHGLACSILRTSRFFPEPDDRAAIRQKYDDANAKVNEMLYRRVDLEDAVSAHLQALERTPSIGFGRYIITATTPFNDTDAAALGTDAPAVLRQRVPDHEQEYARRGWTMFPTIDRIYVNALARRDLGWQPRYDFAHVLDRLKQGDDPRSALARQIGSKGYHRTTTSDQVAG